LRVNAAKISDVRNEHYRQHISRDDDADPKRKAAIISTRHDRRAEGGVDHDPRRLRVVNNISDQSSTLFVPALDPDFLIYRKLSTSRHSSSL
jgi:hypothetical protein